MVTPMTKLARNTSGVPDRGHGARGEGVLTQVKSLSLAEPPFRYTRTRRCIGKAGYSRDCGMYAQQGSSARGSPVSAKARAREPPQTFRNSQRPHLPFNCELSRRDKNKGEFW